MTVNGDYRKRDDGRVTGTHQSRGPHSGVTVTLRSLLCRLVIEDWVRLRQHPENSIWLTLLNRQDGVSLLPRLLPESQQVTVELRDEPQDRSVLEVQLLRETVGKVEFLYDVESKRDEVLDLVLEFLKLALERDVILSKCR